MLSTGNDFQKLNVDFSINIQNEYASCRQNWTQTTKIQSISRNQDTQSVIVYSNVPHNDIDAVDGVHVFYA